MSTEVTQDGKSSLMTDDFSGKFSISVYDYETDELLREYKDIKNNLTTYYMGVHRLTMLKTDWIQREVAPYRGCMLTEHTVSDIGPSNVFPLYNVDSPVVGWTHHGFRNVESELITKHDITCETIDTENYYIIKHTVKYSILSRPKGKFKGIVTYRKKSQLDSERSYVAKYVNTGTASPRNPIGLGGFDSNVSLTQECMINSWADFVREDGELFELELTGQEKVVITYQYVSHINKSKELSREFVLHGKRHTVSFTPVNYSDHDWYGARFEDTERFGTTLRFNLRNPYESNYSAWNTNSEFAPNSIINCFFFFRPLNEYEIHRVYKLVVPEAIKTTTWGQKLEFTDANIGDMLLSFNPPVDWIRTQAFSLEFKLTTKNKE